ncbi:uncharacterized protein LOC110828645 [Zootermopsis nevadensis]|uniref:uncharacterized protein LOC110828645 n=1 Tax=Zootermopsis nevadensis TaxID=136037 RepID=UPI000B8E3ABA|nr:uncharacterized protein LOC110828645 [Zootermopsis nevadensis]
MVQLFCSQYHGSHHSPTHYLQQEILSKVDCTLCSSKNCPLSLWNSTVHRCVYKSPPPHSILSQLNPVRSIDSYRPKAHLTSEVQQPNLPALVVLLPGSKSGPEACVSLSAVCYHLHGLVSPELSRRLEVYNILISQFCIFNFAKSRFLDEGLCCMHFRLVKSIRD